MLVWATAWMTVGCANEPTVHLSYENMVDHLTNLDRLPVIEPGVYCKQFSSYDRRSTYDPVTGQYKNWDANGDAGNFLRIEPGTNEAVMAEMDGPGCIFRIWSANPQGAIRFYLDGDDRPTYEWDFHKLCTGQIEPFIEPLVWKREPNKPNSASNIYLPISFNKSCKVTGVIYKEGGRTEAPGHYYIIDYRTFPKSWVVETFRLPLTFSQAEAVRRAARLWRGSRPVDCMTKQAVIEPGQSVSLADIAGPAVIKEFRAKLYSDEQWATRKVVLRAYWDGESKPSIDCPIGDFFGEPKDANYRSYPMIIDDDINTCYFPMPFRRSARLVAENQGQMPVRIKYSYGYLLREIPDNWGHFKAKWRNELGSTTFDYPLIEATGTGKLVGICLFPDNHHGGWWGEGDEKVYVDGEKFPSWFGTGSEDYFGDAWGIRYFSNPSHGHPQRTIERMQGCYRWHLGDNIPFYESLKMTIENYTGFSSAANRNDYSSVAYWYQLPGGCDFFTETPVGDRIPSPYVVSNAIEAERYLAPADLGEGMTIVGDEDLPERLSRGRGVKLTGRSGSSFTLKIPTESDERFLLRLHHARDVKHSRYRVLQDGRPVDEKVYLRKGMNDITITLVGDPVEDDRCELIVDYFLAEVHRYLIPDWLLIGPFPNPGGKGLHLTYPPENGVVVSEEYIGRDGQKVGWHKISRPDGLIMLNEVIQPKEDCVVYAACVVNAPVARKETLLIGSDDGIKVWINDALVWEHAIQRRMEPDSDRVDVSLKEGRNLMLIKLEQRIGDLGFAIRFLDPHDELTFGLPE